ncbi:MAG TPA: prolyl oligopeptidase family serine peptidase [Ferruginibacter sp.]|nr:prolyl oligopeptidase family serine peptidase [Ferruginibacter sp.]
MVKTIFLYCFLLLSGAGYAQLITVEKIMADPKWIGTQPADIFWAPNSSRLYFNWNPEKALSDSPYTVQLPGTMPVKAGYHEVAMARAANKGLYNSRRNKIVFAYQGDIYLLDVATGSSTRITQTEEAESSPLFCNEDKWIVYQRGGTLYTFEIATGSTMQCLIFKKEKAGPAVSTAQDVFLQQQQLATSAVLTGKKQLAQAKEHHTGTLRSADTIPVIYTGGSDVQRLTISPNGRFITYNLFTAAKAAARTIVPDYVTETGFTTAIPSREKVGRPQGSSVFYFFDRQKGSAMAVDLNILPGLKNMPAYYNDYPQLLKDSSSFKKNVSVLAVAWNNIATTALLDIRSTDFKDRWLVQLDTGSGKIELVDWQHHEAWIAGPGIGNYVAGVLGWLDATTCYFQSEATGYSHLYTCDVNSKIKKPVTSGSYEVQQVQLSANKKYFYLLTNEPHPGIQHFYRIDTDGRNKVQLTSMTGGYEVALSPDEKYIAYRYSYQTKPWELYVQDNAPGKKPMQLTAKAMSDEWKAYPWRDTKIFTFNNRNGQPVYARIYEPAPGKKNNAAILFVHGAGYRQNVMYSWSYYFREYMFNNLLADKGYTVLDIDYTASAGYGSNWRTGIYRHMGGKDLDDHVDAVRFLAKNYGIDTARIGIYGGSYGGFISLMALFTQPDLFKAGAALRPVTDWAHYNDGYTGAILNRPAEDSIAYKRSSPINFADGLKGHLLICHGMVDVNVHYQDAVRLTQRLIELGKDNWELASYPVEDHAFTQPSSWTDEYKRILKLFDSCLLR